MKLVKIILFITFAPLLICLIPILIIAYMCHIGFWDRVGFRGSKRVIKHI